MSERTHKSTQGSIRLSVLTCILLLSMAMAAQQSIKSRYWNYYYPEVQVSNVSDILLQTIPAQIKSFVAGIFRITADEYMHIGPTKKARQNFVAGSFAGNTEIMSLLELSVLLEPANMEMYAIMSHNLALHLNRFRDAIKLLHRGIQANRNEPDLHKLYGAAAYCYGFVKKPSFASPATVKRNREIAVNYLNAAIKSYLANEHRITPYMYDDFANIENYYVLKSRFLSDIGKRQEALETWKKVPYDRQISYLGHFFIMLQQEEPALPEFPDDLLTAEYTAMFQVSTIKPPYGAPAVYRNWLVNPANVYNLAIYSRGFGILSLLADDNNSESADGLNKPPSERSNKQDHEQISADHVCAPGCEDNDKNDDEVCEQGHHHHHGTECPHCASAKSWKQAGTSVMLQALLMLAVSIIIRKFI